MPLTAKQEKFCQSVAKGMNYSDAYRSAYDAKKSKPDSINRLAAGMMKNVKITSRIDELRSKIEENLVYTAKQSFDNLVKAQEMALSRVNGITGEPNPDIRNFLNAEELKGKLAGLYVDKRAFTDSAGNDVESPLVSTSELLNIMERRFERHRPPESAK